MPTVTHKGDSDLHLMSASFYPGLWVLGTRHVVEADSWQRREEGEAGTPAADEVCSQAHLFMHDTGWQTHSLMCVDTDMATYADTQTY